MKPQDAPRCALGAALLTTLALFSCGDLARDNPWDPEGGGLDLDAEIVGRWSLDEGSENQIYVFRTDQRVELKQYTSPDGGPLDRNATFPQTRVRIFAGTYRLVGNLLEIVFTTDPISNDPDDVVTNPPLRTVEISIRRDTLTLKENDGPRLYRRE